MWVVVLVWGSVLLGQSNGVASSEGAGEAEQFRTKFDREVVSERGGQPVLRATRVEKGPVIDGEVDKKPVWQKCGRTKGAWVQIATKEASGRQTVVYACYDAENLYLAFVCEEADLKNVRMDGDLGSGHLLGSDDFVEATLELNGLQGDGQVYSFRANSRSRVAGWGGQPVPKSETEDAGPSVASAWHVPKFQSAGKFGANRWMLEMAIPFAELKRRPADAGMAPPSRGDLVGLKLARYGSTPQDPKDRMISTWNTNIVYPYLHICGSNGLLYFEDSSVLVDSDFSMDASKSPWKVSNDGQRLTQTVAVHPLSYYLISVNGGAPVEVFVDGKKLALKEGKGGLWTAAGQDKVVVSVGGRGANGVAKPASILMEYRPGEEPPGALCLTNNYRSADRNLRSQIPGAPEGTYRYVSIDYAGRILRDDNPSLRSSYIGDAPDAWAFDYNLRVEDVGGKEGTIPFSKGSLTGQNKPVFWLPANPSDYRAWGRRSRVMDIDLGQEYFVKGVDILWPGPNIRNVELWGKVKESDDYTLMYMTDGQYVNPSDRKPRRGYDRVRELDSTVRYLRWRVMQIAGDGSYPQMDGIQEFRVWGEVAAGKQGIKAFVPWVQEKIVPPAEGKTAEMDADVPLIVPRPQELATEEGWFSVDSRTRIVAQDEVEAKRDAQQMHDEILRRWQLDLAIVVAGKDVAGGSTVGDNSIYLGQPRLGADAVRAAQDSDLHVDASKPQGYGLRVTPRRVVVVGNDSDGLYYGVQSLMMAMRWRNANDAAGGGGGAIAVRAMKVLDWPGSALERGLYNRRSYPVVLIVPESELWRVERMCQLLSRFKYNVLYIGPEWRNNPYGPQIAPWAEKKMPLLCRTVREQYHIEIRPTILDEEGEGGGYWLGLSEDLPSLREHAPDENPAELKGSANLCPLDEQTYVRHFAKIDQILADFDYPSKVWMFGQVYADQKEGARWAQCRRCVRSGKSAEELYAYFINRIARHLESKHVKGLFRSPWIRYSEERDPGDKRLFSIDPDKLPANLVYDTWNRDDPYYRIFLDPRNNAYIKSHFRSELTANGPQNWPSSERYLQDAPQPISDMLSALCGTSTATWGLVGTDATLAATVDWMWHAPGKTPAAKLNHSAISNYVYDFWYGYDFPGFRAGTRPNFMMLDLRKYVNHLSHPTGRETLESGRPPEIDLRYLPTGTQMLAGVPFDIIDPAKNDGKGVLMLGRSSPGTIPRVLPTIAEKAGPIPIEKKLASLVFLRKRWHCRTEEMSFEETWLRPTCRVVYEDGTWLPVDSFMYYHSGFFFDEWNNANDVTRPYYRLGWQGNCPNGQQVTLDVVEWVNPYPERTIRQIDFFTPEFEDVRGLRVSDMMEAFVAITGVEPTPRDVAFWKDRPGRIAVLPPRKESAEKGRGIVLKAVDMGRGQGNLVGGAGSIGYAVKLLGGGQIAREYQQIYDICYCDQDFQEFGIEMMLNEPAAFDRLEIRGPVSFAGHWASRAQRKRKVDVSAEVSEDGKTFRKAGELKGLSADVDFIPLDLQGKPIKAIRMMATALPYSENYLPVQVQGDIFDSHCPHANPSFSWRFVAPDVSR